MPEKAQIDVSEIAMQIAHDSQWAKEQTPPPRVDYFIAQGIENIQKALASAIGMFESYCLIHGDSLLFLVTDDESTFNSARDLFDETYRPIIIPSPTYHKVELGLVSIPDAKIIKHQPLVPQRR